MRNLLKLIGIIAMIAVIGFGLVACDPDDNDNNQQQQQQGVTTASGIVTAKTYNTYTGTQTGVNFRFDSDGTTLTITTNLSSPNDSLTLVKGDSSKYIVNLTVDQEVEWSATISSGKFKYEVSDNVVNFEYVN